MKSKISLVPPNSISLFLKRRIVKLKRFRLDGRKFVDQLDDFDVCSDVVDFQRQNRRNVIDFLCDRRCVTVVLLSDLRQNV